ncbi:hypothetical protein GPECTOR_119g396 [Gonium pectorale]|uniref:Pre-mRNA-splicing factor CWC26 n=1 Tax=Gonium pectorale TaxID=33097 RepID=A0A150FZX3_GONPE|nr:hypothetical protein GPECTOR_119g396 [Gonium pectorale]|eukprot:KXZ42765.1 hypothetical protein GPECTOR_119g396 [Gonium pectorale]
MSFAVKQTLQTGRASKSENLFSGLSTLRADEKNKAEKPKDASLQAYLAKKYASGDDDKGTSLEGKRKKKKKSTGADAIRIVDRDVSGFQPVDPSSKRSVLKRDALGGDDDDEGEEDAPTIANLEEAEALMKQVDKLADDIRKQKEQAEERRRNAEGRGAQTVYRDKATGRVMTAEEALKAKEDERAARKKPSIYDEDQTLEWRAGLAQKREAEERRRALQEEDIVCVFDMQAAKPFARADVDGAHDAALRDVVRFGDPFANLARKKKAAAAAEVAASLTDRYDSEKLNKSGFKIPQEIPPYSWITRKVAAPANRYNIRPGRHWDGVDRSTGFEKELFAHQNTRAAKELEARLWSMGDM